MTATPHGSVCVGFVCSRAASRACAIALLIRSQILVTEKDNYTEKM